MPLKLVAYLARPHVPKANLRADAPGGNRFPVGRKSDSIESPQAIREPELANLLSRAQGVEVEEVVRSPDTQALTIRGEGNRPYLLDLPLGQPVELFTGERFPQTYGVVVTARG
jgi:hypothetical protein